MAERKKYYIRVSNTLVPVTQEVYQAYHQAKRKAKTLYEKDERHGLVSYDGMDTEDTLGEEMISDRDTPSVEDIVLNKLRKEKLRLCLLQLTEEERALILALFSEEKTERSYARLAGLSQSGINKQKQVILCKLRKMIES